MYETQLNLDTAAAARVVRRVGGGQAQLVVAVREECHLCTSWQGHDPRRDMSCAAMHLVQVEDARRPVGLLRREARGCRSVAPSPPAQEPEIRAAFTTMGNMIVMPGRSTTCPSWFWEQWTVAIGSDGTTEVAVSDGQRTVHPRHFVLSADRHQKIAAFLEKHLPPTSRTIGIASTDSDYGRISLGGERTLNAEGANESDRSFATFYRIVRYLERKLAIQNPYCH